MHKSSKEIYEEACHILPGGISRNTVYRYPHPSYVEQATGCYITDIEGNSRIDFAANLASLIHGHAFPPVVNAVIEQLKRGTAYTMATEAEVKFAQLLTSRSKGFEMIRFVNSGTEAVMATIKASRAFTGRPKIAKAEGAYHGTYDFAEVSQTANPATWGELDQPNSTAVVYGTPQGVLNDVVVFPFNDVERTLAILNRYKDTIACVLLDPVPHRIGLIPATRQYVEALYKWTRENGALLVFDEVVTYRVSYAGAQANYAVTPDLTALGKIIGGGFPVGAITGRADIMSVLDPRASKVLFPHSGTFSANPVTMTAGRVAMEHFDQSAVDKLNQFTAKAIEQIRGVISTAVVPVSITGAGSMFKFHFLAAPPATYREAYQGKEVSALVTEFLDYLFTSENILLTNSCSCMFSTVLTQVEIDRLSEALYNGFRLIKPKLESL